MTRTIAENLMQDCRSAHPEIALNAMRVIEEARDWLADCVWENMEPEDFDSLGTYQIVAGVDRYYEGGWAAFARSL